MSTALNLPSWSKKLKQCQNCMKSESEQDRLLSCSGCKRAHYCSTECQRVDWKSHKRICELTRSMRRDMKQNPDNSAMRLFGVPVAKSDQVSKKWVQQYRGLLTPTGYVALDLRAHPERRLTHFLTVVLIPTFTAEDIPVRDEDIQTAFVLDDAMVQPWDDLNGKSENLAALKLAQDGIERSKERYPESFGFVVAVLIPACNIVRMVPLMFEVTPPPTIDSLVAPDWKLSLEQKIAAGTPL